MLTDRDVASLLTLRGADQEELFAQARRLRYARFGDQAVVRGVCEVTNVCRVDCDFCPMRRSNTRTNDRFHQPPVDLVQVAAIIRRHGINVVCFQGGEVPQTTRTLAEAIPGVREAYGGAVEVLLNLGNKTRDEYARLREAGATSYILKHETSDPVLHARLRHESLDHRLDRLRDLLDLGYRVGTGTIVGLPGQSRDSLARDITLARDLGVHMCSAAPFIPAPDTPLSGAPAGDVDLTLNVIAAMRLVNPQWTIPTVSALSKLTPDGQRRGFDAGANVIVANFTPPVQRDKYLIYGRDRHVADYDFVRGVIAAAGLVPGPSVFVDA